MREWTDIADQKKEAKEQQAADRQAKKDQAEYDAVNGGYDENDYDDYGRYIGKPIDATHAPDRDDIEFN